MSKWKEWAAVIALAVAPLSVAACDGGDGDVEDPDQVEQQVDELEQDVRENTP